MQIQDEMLFPWISSQIENFLFSNSMEKKDLINLGIGDVCFPLSPLIVKSLIDASAEMGKKTIGYLDEQGLSSLREKITEIVYPKNNFSKQEIFICEGIANSLSMLLKMFPSGSTFGILSPTYPVYKTLLTLLNMHIVEIDPEEISSSNLKDKNFDALIICSPNNPTGIAFDKASLTYLVNFAIHTKTLILLDGAYESFIKDKNFPRSIYEIDGAKQVAIELRSFSKSLGFSALRLGYFTVPKELKYKEEFFLPLCQKTIAASTNGVSYLSQSAGMTALSKEGLEEIERLSNHYMGMIKRLKEHLIDQNQKVIGGEHAPYLFWNIGGDSKNHFQRLLRENHLITIPGKGFGKDGYLRLSGFIEEKTLQKALKVLHFS
jgi:LL-diaminopimelate aminotransferase